MSTDQLIQEIEQREYILPKDILKNMSEEELINELEEIFEKHRQKLSKENDFRRKYIELINYIFVLNLRRDKKKQKKELFDKELINFLLSTPEAA